MKRKMVVKVWSLNLLTSRLNKSPIFALISWWEIAPIFKMKAAFSLRKFSRFNSQVHLHSILEIQTQEKTSTQNP